ncbi:hypothetical protein L198_02619 [Cryptococcus wingfieldii CBS 7118]|uniref:Uncharacterized protein n=1 Tax=Cryptococcus wingfieldii CBS 7118 TaxID=1295528 RepID=A0A1E3JM10_9TREE|nr:hypothetical protein L198_02619 [Cryptococcus wingfieldii CBS 7118]ODO01890.1 hypothetical protein L198_02619 [Cryptococcus wingfieldii CBS 7118]
MLMYTAAGPIMSSAPFYNPVYGSMYTGWGRYGVGPNYGTGWGGSWYGQNPYSYMSGTYW